MTLMPAHDYYPESLDCLKIFCLARRELITLVEFDNKGLSPKLEPIIRAFEFTQIELAVYRDPGYAQGSAGMIRIDTVWLAHSPLWML